MASPRPEVYDRNGNGCFRGHFSPHFASGLPLRQHRVAQPSQVWPPPPPPLLYNYQCFRRFSQARIVLEFEKWDGTVHPAKKLESSYGLVERQCTQQNEALRSKLKDPDFVDEYKVKRHVREDFETDEDWWRFVAEKVFKHGTKAKHFHWGLGCTKNVFDKMLEFMTDQEEERRGKDKEKGKDIIIDWMDHDEGHVTDPSCVIVGECEEADSDGD